MPVLDLYFFKVGLTHKSSLNDCKFIDCILYAFRILKNHYNNPLVFIFVVLLTLLPLFKSFFKLFTVVSNCIDFSSGASSKFAYPDLLILTGFLSFFMKLIKLKLEKFNLLVGLLSMVALLIGVTRHNLIFPESLLKNPCYLFFCNFCPNVRINTSYKNCMFRYESFNELLSRCELSLAHFTTEVIQKVIGYNCIQGCNN